MSAPLAADALKTAQPGCRTPRQCGNTGTGLSTPSTLARSRWNDSDNGFSPTFMITGASTRLSRSDSGPSAPGETDSKKLRGAPAVEAGWRYAFLTPDEI